jgi:hypothetical protein
MFSGNSPNNKWWMLCCIFVLLVVVGAIYEAVFPPRPQPPLPRMPLILRRNSDWGTPFNIKVKAIDGPKDQVGAGLDVAPILWPGDKESITVFYVRKSDADRKKQMKAAVQLAWENIKIQLPDDDPQAVEIVVLRKEGYFDEELPEIDFESFVVIRGVVRRDKKSGLFPEIVTEWR